LGPDEYDVAAAGTGVVEADQMLGPDRVVAGDVVIAFASSGLHSNGYSLARHIIARAGLSLEEVVGATGRTLGEELLEPTLLYTPVVVALLDESREGIHAFSHVTGGGIAQNLQRVIPPGLAVSVDRSTWKPPEIMRLLAEAGSLHLAEVEDTWNMGVGFFAITDPRQAERVIDFCRRAGVEAWPVGAVSEMAETTSDEGWVSGAKGVSGGAVRLVGDYSSSSSV
jgi:phosphoribosylformylglycinamidine cyclo-ligase